MVLLSFREFVQKSGSILAPLNMAVIILIVLQRVLREVKDNMHCRFSRMRIESLKIVLKKVVMFYRVTLPPMK